MRPARSCLARTISSVFLGGVGGGVAAVIYDDISVSTTTVQIRHYSSTRRRQRYFGLGTGGVQTNPTIKTGNGAIRLYYCYCYYYYYYINDGDRFSLEFDLLLL